MKHRSDGNNYEGISQGERSWLKSGNYMHVYFVQKLPCYLLVARDCVGIGLGAGS